MSRRKEYRRYSHSFKATAVKMSHIAGVQCKDVAESLDIHPLMLSRWRKDYREGRIMAQGKDIKLDSREVAELKRLKRVEKQYKLLKEQHSLLKKSIQFTLEQKKKLLRSSSKMKKDTK